MLRSFLISVLVQISFSSRPPNIVILLVDDLGIGDIGCFGNTTLPTPHVDSLCRAGAVLSHHVTPAVVCTPSRAALLTGRYAVRMGLTGLQDTPPVIISASGRAGLPSNETSLARIASEAGYRTAAVGKVSTLNCIFIGKVIFYILTFISLTKGFKLDCSGTSA